MTHGEARLLIGGDPQTVPPELAGHLAGCPECAQFQREMTALDANIRRALDLAPPGAAPAPAAVVSPAPVVSIAEARTNASAQIPARKRARPWSGWALAASAALVSILGVWVLRPNDSLAHDVVKHVQHESNSWTSDEHVTPADVTDTLAQAGVALDAGSDKVMYAHSCTFHGHVVPHLVVSTPKGRVTVMVLRYENVTRRISFHEGGMTGVIIPAPHGSMAVLMQGDDNIDAVAQQMQQSVHWLP
jgi:Protein of unknown function (DUF3379)